MMQCDFAQVAENFAVNSHPTLPHPHTLLGSSPQRTLGFPSAFLRLSYHPFSPPFPKLPVDQGDTDLEPWPSHPPLESSKTLQLRLHVVTKRNLGYTFHSQRFILVSLSVCACLYAKSLQFSSVQSLSRV